MRGSLPQGEGLRDPSVVRLRRPQQGRPRHLGKEPLTLGQNVGLDVPVVILARPDEAPRRLQHLGHHVVDQAVLVPDAELVEVGLVVPVGGRGSLAGGAFVLLQGRCGLDWVL